MNFQSLKYFVATAKRKNFTAVAEEMYVSQPAISRQIQLLESNLGVKLFHRTKPNLTLTEDGQLLLERAERIVQQVEDLYTLSSERAHGHYGTLRIGFTGGLELDALMRFSSAAATYFPNCALEYECGNMMVLQRKLKEGAYDLVFTPLSGFTDDPELETFLISEPLYCLAVSEIHPLANRETISFRELENEKFAIILREESTAHSDRLLQQCSAAGFIPKHIYEVPNTLVHMLMVASNQAVALVGKNIQEFYNIGIKFINITDLLDNYVKVGIIWKKDCLSPLAEKVLKTIC